MSIFRRSYRVASNEHFRLLNSVHIRSYGNKQRKLNIDGPKQKKLAQENYRRWARPMKTVNNNIKTVGHPSAEVSHPFPEPKYDPEEHRSFTAKQTNNKLFAVIALGSTQFKVSNGDLIVVNKLPLREAQVGKLLDMTDVLLVANKDETIVGRPLVEGAVVTGLVQEQAKDAKVVCYKRRKRNKSATWKGFRRQVTLIRIKKISCPLLKTVSEDCTLNTLDEVIYGPGPDLSLGLSVQKDYITKIPEINEALEAKRLAKKQGLKTRAKVKEAANLLVTEQNVENSQTEEDATNNAVPKDQITVPEQDTSESEDLSKY